MTRIYKRPQRPSIYWALEEVRKIEKRLGKPCAYRHIKRELNLAADDMTRRARPANPLVIFHKGQLPEDAPPLQMADVYQAQGAKPQLNWGTLPPPLELPPTDSSPFGNTLVSRIMINAAKEQAIQQNSEVLPSHQDWRQAFNPDVYTPTSLPSI